MNRHRPVNYKVGDRVEFGVCISERETGPGTVRRIDDDTVEVELGNGHWVTTWRTPSHLHKIEDATQGRDPVVSVECVSV
jgi:hypothetical protein